jgi:hypothetical protein
MTVKLPIKGHFGQVARLLGIGVDAAPSAEDWVEVGEPPESPSTAWEYGEDEALLPAFGRGLLGYESPEWTSAVIALTAAPSEPVLAICTDNDSHTWAVAGYAITRVRVFNRLHRYARMAMELPGSTSEENQAAAGCLDSAFYGPAKVLGYAYIADGGGVGFRQDIVTVVPPVWPAFDLRWALVQF